MIDSVQVTGTKDTSFNLVSVLYHALRSADTYDKYIRDARESRDEELEQFFRNAQTHNRAMADQAKKLLAKRLERYSGYLEEAFAPQEGANPTAEMPPTGFIQKAARQE